MGSDPLPSPHGPYLDLSGHFPKPVFAFITLKGFDDASPEVLREFLAWSGHPVKTVHRVDQVHSARVVEASQSPCEADALVSFGPGEAVRVVTADCVPVLLASRDGARYAAVHAGWKGTLARIAQAAVRAMGVPPGTLHAVIGPAIGPCCYAVDRERYGRFAEAFPGWLSPGEGKRTLDLQALNRRQLEEVGVEPSSIRVEARCTACSVGLCCSYRRDGERAGRMAALIGRDA